MTEVNVCFPAGRELDGPDVTNPESRSAAYVTVPGGLRAPVADGPLWRLDADLSPVTLVSIVDFRGVADALVLGSGYAGRAVAG